MSLVQNPKGFFCFVLLFFPLSLNQVKLWPKILHVICLNIYCAVTINKFTGWSHSCNCKTELSLLQICFQLSKVKSCSVSLSPSCGYAISNSHMTSIPGHLACTQAGLAVFFLGVSRCLCLCFCSLGSTCQNTLHYFVSPHIRLQLCFLDSHHKEYFVHLKCVCSFYVSSEVKV